MDQDTPIIAALELGMEKAERIAFQHALQFDLEPLRVLSQKQFSKDPIRLVGASFEINLNRALDQLAAPAYIIYWARTAQRAEYEATAEIIGSPFPPAQMDEETRSRCNRAAEIKHYQWFQETLANGLPKTELMQAEALVSGVIAHGTRVSNGFIAMLANTVINLWTAYETLAGDLWETALNIHPHELAKLQGQKKHKSHASDDDKDSKQVDLNFLHKHRYDVSEVMGTLLKTRYEFSRIEKIREAYKDAFWCEFPDVDTMVGDTLYALACTRNLLVHKAGIVDEKFLRNTKRIGIFTGAVVGEELFIDGKLVAKFIVDTLTSGIALVRAVDDWLGAH
jgi:hypothetical protein